MNRVKMDATVPGTRSSVTKLLLPFLFFSLGGGIQSETSVAGNLKGELRVGLLHASNTLRDIYAQPCLIWSENGQQTLLSHFFILRIKSRSTKFGNKVWARHHNKSPQNFIA